MTPSHLLLCYIQENFHIKVLGIVILLPHNALKHWTHSTLHALVPPRLISTHEIRILRSQIELGIFFGTLEIPSWPNGLHSDICKPYVLNISPETLSIRPIRSPGLRVRVIGFEMPRRHLPRRVEAQFAPHAQAECASRFGHAVHFSQCAERVRSELNHERAQAVRESVIRNQAEIERIQNLTFELRQAFLFNGL